MFGIVANIVLGLLRSVFGIAPGTGTTNISVSKSVTNAGVLGQVVAVTTASTDASNTRQSAAFVFTATVGAANTQDNTQSGGGLLGFNGSAIVASGSSGTLTLIVGGQVTLSHFGSGTVTTAVGFRISSNFNGSGTITNAVGIACPDITRGTNNTNLLLGTLTPPSGDYGIYSAGTDPSQFAGQVRVATLGVGNSAAGSTPGTCVKKIEVFDAAGTSLGYVPVYDAIT